MFKKIGESIELTATSVQDINSSIPMVDPKVIENFGKFASNLKKIAPKADDFLYFSAVIIHAAEAALINDDGTPKFTANGEVATAEWDKTGGSWRWKSNDPNIKPYKNSNSDIFPEQELVKAYRKWVHKPLCIDHKSSSVDHVRGFIVDTVYDRQLKRVIALCALDKKNYPDLARKVSTGYSSSVSMGTAVSEAVCSDCGTVARVEADFCKCMRNKSCYGEINTGLNPLELSIVVNGADPKAQIKYIYAAAQTLSNYVESKASALKKIANNSYSANIVIEENLNTPNHKTTEFSLTNDTLEALQSEVTDAFEKAKELKLSLEEKDFEKDTTNDASQTESTVDMPGIDTETTDFGSPPPVADRFASADVQAVKERLAIIDSNLTQMQRDLNKLANNINISNKKQEEIMSGSRDNGLNKQSYYQGAGGVNEPTPGQVKYPKDPLQDDLRESGDKHMTGPTPFPGVGNVEDMYPGVGEKDLEIKKLHARAAVEERAQKRAALVNKAKESIENRKVGYFQADPKNVPTPGKKQYPVDPTQDDLREADDKQMVGKAPFPGVGKVDGLYGNDMKAKELVNRASITAKFMKNSEDLSKSVWQVYAADKLIFTASVDEITAGNTEKLYGVIATKAYGEDLIGKIKSQGANKVKSLFKSSQAAPPAPPAPPPASEAAPEEETKDTGAEGDPKEVALELSEKVKDLSSDLNEAVKALTGEQAEMGDVGEMGDIGAPPQLNAADDGQVTTAALQTMRKELNPALLQACKEAVASLNDHAVELNTIVAMYDKGAVTESNKDFVDSLVQDAVVEAKEAFADSFSLLNGFVRYARGTQAIVKRAKQEAELNKFAHHGEDTMPGHMGHKGHEGGLMAMVDEVHADDSDADVDSFDAMLANDITSSANYADDIDASDDAEADDNDNSDPNGTLVTKDPEAARQSALKGQPATLVTSSLNSKAGRAAERAKLAAEMKFNPMLQDFHKHLEGPDFEVKPSGDYGHVETVEEIHESMLDLAKMPVKVRKEAEAIQRLVSEGSLNPSDLPQLVANGLDADAVKYWKQFYGQAGSEGSQFASELVKEHVKAQVDEQVNLYRVKLARAFELTYEMIDRGLLSRERSTINEQVDQVMKWNDEGFESMKRVIAKHAPNTVKTAGRMPQVGISNPGEETAGSDDMASLLALAFSKSGKRLF